ncbi:hypothetical protein VIGAN_10213300 [Vigna angularis var. angularis]|uniref:Uncharacterized protein n=1 Tax=Vigna angularis var. angularis TaxID=157739 RepID=A0A0S3T6I1_PHAAN|nr:hypothetical protein VIGAN_10213300 [Vigna angularis var. angularis]
MFCELTFSENYYYSENIVLEDQPRRKRPGPVFPGGGKKNSLMTVELTWIPPLYYCEMRYHYEKCWKIQNQGLSRNPLFGHGYGHVPGNMLELLYFPLLVLSLKEY